MEAVTSCGLCPRRCGVNRTRGYGRCGGGGGARVAHHMLHRWEEPCISGTRGSGAVFFAGCGLGCVFCQNRAIQGHGVGTVMNTRRLAGLFCRLQAQGAHNLNLVTAAHYRPWVLEALGAARVMGCALPAVWNTGGYETEQAVRELAGAVDVWLFDLKYHSSELSGRLAGAPDYFDVAAAALKGACAAAGLPVIDGSGLLVRGVLVRVPVLPGQHRDAVRLLEFLAGGLPRDGFLLSLMSQYTPPAGAALPPPLNRRLASYEYRRAADAALSLGLTNGYFQDRASAHVRYVPPFGQGR